MKESKVDLLAFEMALRIIKIAERLRKEKKFVFSDQLLRAGTSVGANTREAQHPQLLKDFAHKMSIALKECAECIYWLELLKASETLPSDLMDAEVSKALDIQWMLRAIIKTSKERMRTS